MGVEHSNPRVASPKPTTRKPSNNVYAQMAKKVIQSKEELYLEHSKKVKDSFNSTGYYDLNTEVYYDFINKYDTMSVSSNTKSRSDFRGLEESPPTIKSSRTEVKKGRSGSMRRSQIKNELLKFSLGSYQIRKGRNNPMAKVISASSRSKSNIRDPAVKGIELHPNNKLSPASATKTTSPVKYEKAIVLRQIPEERQQRFDQISLLPWNIFMKILSYGIEDFRCYLSVNPSWYVSTLTAFDNFFNVVENGFVSAYSDYLLFKDSYTSSSKINFCGQSGVRIDRVIRCENLITTLGKTVTISYTFKYCNEPKNTYKAEFIYDSVKRAPRYLWIHKNECLFHKDDVVRANTQPVMPICINDNLEVAVNFYSLRGLIDVASINWLSPVLSETPIENTLNYRREKQMSKEEDKSVKLVADLSRVCELEDSQQEWRYPMYYSFPSEALNFISGLKSLFIVKQVEFANVDILAIKVQLLAAQKGNLPYKALGIGVKVLDYDSECTNEVKRTGLLIERHCDVEVRVGDIVVFYLSKSEQTNKKTH